MMQELAVLHNRHLVEALGTVPGAVHHTVPGVEERHIGPAVVERHTVPVAAVRRTVLEAEARHTGLEEGVRRIDLEEELHIDRAVAADIVQVERHIRAVVVEEHRIGLVVEGRRTVLVVVAHHTGLVVVAGHTLVEAGNRPVDTVGSALVAAGTADAEVVRSLGVGALDSISMYSAIALLAKCLTAYRMHDQQAKQGCMNLRP